MRMSPMWPRAIPAPWIRSVIMSFGKTPLFRPIPINKLADSSSDKVTLGLIGLENGALLNEDCHGLVLQSFYLNSSLYSFNVFPVSGTAPAIFSKISSNIFAPPGIFLLAVSLETEQINYFRSFYIILLNKESVRRFYYICGFFNI